MSDWAPKRFWSEVSVVDEDAGFGVRLDDRLLRTPAKHPLVAPTAAVAKKIAAEWEAQIEVVDPSTMPWTRSANAAIDKVALQRAEVETHLIDYAGTDLLSYRADGPESLVTRQKNAWDPILDWVADTTGARLQVTFGVMPIQQSRDALATLKQQMAGMSDFQLTGFYDLVTLSGSFALALKAAENGGLASDLWAISRLDEDWQSEQWGVDEEAAEQANLKKLAFFHATEFYHISQ